MNDLKKLGLTEDNFVWLFDNGDYKYMKDWIEYLLSPKGQLKCKGDFVWSYDNGNYKYEKNGKTYYYNKECDYWTIDGVEYYCHKKGNYWTIDGITIKELKKNIKELEEVNKK